MNVGAPMRQYPVFSLLMFSEADLACCRAPRYRMGRAYVKEYFKNILPSKPEEDFEDRFALYAMYVKHQHSEVPCH